MGKGPYATPSLHPTLYRKLMELCKKKKEKGPFPTAPDLLNMSMLYLLLELTETPDPELARLARDLKHLQSAFEAMPDKLFKKN